MVNLAQFIPGDSDSRICQRRKMNSPGRVPFPQLLDQAPEGQDFADRNGVDPEPGRGGGTRPQAESQPFEEMDSLALQDLDSKGIKGKIEQDG